MILLDTSTSLKIVLDSTPTTELDWVSVYLDTIDNVPHHSDGKTNGTIDATLVSSPSSDNRLVRYINVYNNDSSQVKATIKIDDGTNERILVNSTIDSEITLVYDSYAGWYLISATNYLTETDLTSVTEVSFSSEYDNGTVSSNTDIDWSNGNNQVITLGADVTFTFSNMGVGHKQLRVVQDSFGSRTPTLPIGKWIGGIAGSFSTSASAEDIISIFYNKTDYYYQLSKDWS